MCLEFKSCFEKSIQKERLKVLYGGHERKLLSHQQQWKKELREQRRQPRYGCHKTKKFEKEKVR